MTSPWATSSTIAKRSVRFGQRSSIESAQCVVPGKAKFDPVDRLSSADHWPVYSDFAGQDS